MPATIPQFAERPRRQAQPPSQADRLSEALDDLLALEQRIRLGHPTHAGVEDDVDEGRRLAQVIHDIFHGQAGRPVHRIWISADGRTAGG